MSKKFKTGQMVRYVSEIMPHMKGRIGTVEGTARDGWIEVKFPGSVAPVKCADVSLEPVEPRVAALFSCFDILTSYLLDECPDGENWEDFDPAIDELRTEIAELLGED